MLRPVLIFQAPTRSQRETTKHPDQWSGLYESPAYFWIFYRKPLGAASFCNTCIKITHKKRSGRVEAGLANRNSPCLRVSRLRRLFASNSRLKLVPASVFSLAAYLLNCFGSNHLVCHSLFRYRPRSTCSVLCDSQCLFSSLCFFSLCFFSDPAPLTPLERAGLFFRREPIEHAACQGFASCG